MILLENIYQFYDLPDEEAKKLVGQIIEESERKPQKPSDKRNNPNPPKKWAIYFPVGLENENTNYGKKYGLIGLSHVFNHWKNKTPYFRVFAMCPDDLDVGITYQGDGMEELRQKVYDFMLSLPFEETDYREIMQLIIEHVGYGKID